MSDQQGSAGIETIAHGVPLPDDPEHSEFVHPEAQGMIALVFAVLACLLLALLPVATRSAPMQKGWWVEPATWPIFTLAITLAASAFQVLAWLRIAARSTDRGTFVRRSRWAFGNLQPALEYSGIFLVYLFMIVFAIVGRIMIGNDIPAFPMVIGLVLGPLFEWRFAQSMSLSNGNILVFFERPISATLIGLAVFGILVFALIGLRRRRTPLPDQGDQSGS
ncbi:hypothetical protein OEW28_11635 [Defluviimonas sp. WL0002]|uniref:Tripartite tricarboxylate transporter TctB family protein n=1 Tax=Albidovulum marisflavi TaxID=2984159 RepID=A0ABT2ZDS6_9RHOB|nr:hypothetical protein [Defluviimonas sp. WL0002]MCV2869277.1 hypothetical protein [Defluviimonas sp. WL0002]